jgi:hypothetical protein
MVAQHYNGEKFEYIGSLSSPRFQRGARVWDLRKMTDSDVALLLQMEPEYWGTHFRERSIPAPAQRRSVKRKAQATEEEE